MDVKLQKIADLWRTNHSLSDPSVSEIAISLKSHSSIGEAVNRLCDPSRKVGYHEIMDNAERRVSMVCSHGNWSVSVMMDYAADGEVALSTYPTIIMPLYGARIEIDIYECAPENFTESFVQNLRLGPPLERKSISEGEYWATPRKGVFADIISVVPGKENLEPVILLVSGEPYAPYVRCFDRTGAMTATVYSSNKLNSEQFFADFLKNMTGSDFLDYMIDREIDDLRAYLNDQLSDPSNLLTEALWPMVQTAGNLDRSLGLQALESVASSSHELASRAAAILEKQSAALRGGRNA